MRLVKVAAATLNQTPFDWDGNKENILTAMHLAREASVDVLCLPELSITGYGCEDMFNSPALRREAMEMVAELATESHGLVVAVGLPVLFNNALFNTTCLLVDGAIAGFVAKQHLAGEGLHYEPRWFKPWPAGVRVQIPVGTGDFPLGDLLFDVGGVRLGFEICEDAWVAGRPGNALARRGVDIILNPSASHFAFDKFPVRKGFVREGSRAFGVTYVYTNLMGNESGRAIYDGGALIASAGALEAEGERFSYHRVTLTSRVIDIDRTRRIQSSTASFRPLVGHDENTVDVAFRTGAHSPEPAGPVPASWETGPWLREEEFVRSVSLALFDYLRKSRSRGFVVSLSGGADSTAVACLVAMSVRLGCQQLGVDGFKARLGYIGLKGDTAEALVGELLTCAYQGTENSSDTTRNAARDVAEGIGARFLEFDVDPLVKHYVGMVEGALGRDLTWENDDLALQNIQARVRGPGVWMLANLSGSLLLSTSNRSECSVGYATMDGDTCGGISPIAGINKAYLREWLRWLETTGPEGLGPIPAVRAVNVQQPTAELRPPSEGQTDEADLMPYDVLDAIEELAVRDKQAPVEVFESLRPQYPDVSAAQLQAWIERFFTMWCRSQWKRERYAPTFHVDDENVDPKTWCRFPILSGGYAREIRDLKRGNGL